MASEPDFTPDDIARQMDADIFGMDPTDEWYDPVYIYRCSDPRLTPRDDGQLAIQLQHILAEINAVIPDWERSTMWVNSPEDPEPLMVRIRAGEFDEPDGRGGPVLSDLMKHYRQIPNG